MDFDRWTPVRDHSWPYYIFKQYNEELMRMRMAHKSVHCQWQESIYKVISKIK